MQCLIKKYYKKLLEEYSRILGSEEAAYYVLAMNNGNPLTENPDGTPSSLYAKLLEETGSHELAILNMAVVFTPEYIDKYGDWTNGFKQSEGSVPPDFGTLQGIIPGFGQFDSPSGIDSYLSDLAVQFVHIHELLNEADRRPLIQKAVEMDQDRFITSRINQFVDEHPTATDDEIDIEKCKFKREFNMNLFFRAVNHLTTYLEHNGFKNTQAGREFIHSLQSTRFVDSTVFGRDGTKVLILLDLIQRVLYNQDLSVVPKEFAQLYIRTFFSAPAIQEAIEIVRQKTGFSSTEQLISALANEITNRTTNKLSYRAQEAINNFWHKFKNMLRKLFRRELVDYKRRNEVLDVVTTAFSVNENLADLLNENLIRDLADLDIPYDSHMSNPSRVIAKIKKGLTSRIKSLESSSNLTTEEKKQTLLNLKDTLDKIEKLSTVSENELEDERMEVIKGFIAMGLVEISNTINKLNAIGKRLDTETRRYVYKDRKREYKKYKYNSEVPFNVTLEELIKLKTDIVGFYSTIIESELFGLLEVSDHPDLEKGSALRENIDLIIEKSAALQGSIRNKIEQYAEIIVERCSDECVEVGNKERFKINALKWLKNQINKGDLSWIEKLVGSAASSASPIVRMADFLIRLVNQEVHIKSVTKGKELLRLYDKAIPFFARFSPSNYARLFYEMDEDGKPTGNLVSAVNEGMAENKRQKLIQKLNKKYKIKEVDHDGRPIFNDDDTWHEYMDDYDEGLERLHIHRRYTAQYYILLRKCLSRNTIEVINNINKEIQKIYDRCFDEELGVPITANLKPEYKRKLAQLLEYKQDLANPYIIEKDDSGKITSIRLKLGELADIAKELTLWNAEKQGLIKYENDFDKFEQAYQKVKDNFGEDSDEAKLFYREHVFNTLSDEYYDTARNAFVQHKDERVTKLLARKRAIVNATKLLKGYVMPNLDLLNDEAWAELKAIDTELAKIKEKSRPTSKQAADAYSQRVTKLQVIKLGTDNVPYIKWLEDHVSADELEEKYYFEDPQGNKKPLSVFTYNGPVNKRDIVKGLTSPFTAIDEDSYFVNENFDPTRKQALQPDAKYYHNPVYDKITDPSSKGYNEDAHKLYDFVLLMLDECWEMLPDLSHSRFQLPQRRDRNGQLITKTQGKWKNAKAMASNMFTVNENDIEYNEEFVTMPDGSVVNNIPIRWVARLDDPSTISTDLVQLMTAFYEMALNYDLKSKIRPELEILHAELRQTSDIEPSDLTKRLEKHLEMYMYGRTRTGLRKNRRMGYAEQLASKAAYSLNEAGHSKLMPKNIISILKNWNDSTFSLIAEMVGGRHFTISSFWRSLKHMAKEVNWDTLLTSAGRVNMKSWTGQCLLTSGVSGSINDIFGKQNETWFRRVVTNFFSMGEYTLIDYIFKGLIANMIYDSRRLITHPVTGEQEFMTRQRAEWVWSQEFGDKKAGRQAWEKAELTLHDAYHVDKQGNFVIKPLFKDIIRPIKADGTESYKLETLVAGTIKERCAIINGMLDEMDKNGLSLNYLGAMVLLMRGWMVSQLVDYSKTGHDFAVYYETDDVSKSMSWAKKKYAQLVDPAMDRILEEDPNFSGLFNFLSTIVEKGWWHKLLGAYYRYYRGQGLWRHGPLRMFIKNGYDDMTDHLIYQIRRAEMCNLAFVACFAMGWVAKIWIETLFNTGGGNGDDDDRDIFKLIADEDYEKLLLKLEAWSAYLLLTVGAASASERLSQLGPIGFGLNIIELVQTIFISSSYIKDLKYVGNALYDTVELMARGLGITDTPKAEDDPLLLKVKTGVYAGYPTWVRDYSQAMSEIPGVNQFGVTNIVKRGTIQGLKKTGQFYTGTMNQFMIPFPTARTSKNLKTNLFDYWDALSADDAIEKNNKSKKKSSGGGLRPPGRSGGSKMPHL